MAFGAIGVILGVAALCRRTALGEYDLWSRERAYCAIVLYHVSRLISE